MLIAIFKVKVCFPIATKTERTDDLDERTNGSFIIIQAKFSYHFVGMRVGT